MSQPCIQESQTRVGYTCMLWNVESGKPTVISVHDERHDRWIGRRCVAAMTSFEAPIEMFMKSEWRRTETPQEEQPEEEQDAPVLDARARYLRAFKGGSTP